MKEKSGKIMQLKTVTALFLLFICLSISGCGDSSKNQIIAVYDYTDNTEKDYDTSDTAMDNLVNQIFDYIMDAENSTDKIPGEALGYKRIEVFQTDGKRSGKPQKTDDNRLINIELYKYSNEFYCKACFNFSDQEYTVRLSSDIAAQVKNLEKNGQ